MRKLLDSLILLIVVAALWAFTAWWLIAAIDNRLQEFAAWILATGIALWVLVRTWLMRWRGQSLTDILNSPWD